MSQCRGPLVKVEISPLGILALSLWIEELERCPTCGSLKTRPDRSEPSLRDCLDCGAWFDPFDPAWISIAEKRIKGSI